MRVRKNIATSEEGFLFNPATGDSFSTNAIGAEIILLLKQGKSTRAIIEEMCNKFDVEQDLFERDLDEFTTVLKEFNILE